MVYTANWVIIYHLPPTKGTRNSYFRSILLATATPSWLAESQHLQLVTFEDVLNTAHAQWFTHDIPWSPGISQPPGEGCHFVTWWKSVGGGNSAVQVLCLGTSDCSKSVFWAPKRPIPTLDPPKSSLTLLQCLHHFRVR